MKEKTLKHATLCFLFKDGYTTLAIKTRHIGEGCRNGYGGGIKDGETPEDAVLRELSEESRVTAKLKDLQKVAIADCHNTKEDGTIFVCRVHIFLVLHWAGDPEETEEMIRPERFHKDDLPLGEMMLADREWIREILNGKKLLITARYGPFQKTLLGPVEIREVDSFDE